MAKSVKQNRDNLLILALAGGATVRDAAKEAGVHERTAHRRMDDPDFRQQVTEARDALFSRAMARLADAACEAVATLTALLKSDSDMVRLGAARAILDNGPKLRDAVDIVTRIEALEKANSPKLRGVA